MSLLLFLRYKLLPTYDKSIHSKSFIGFVNFNRIYDLITILLKLKLNNFLRILIVVAIKIVGRFCCKKNYLFLWYFDEFL